jgi:hypothetical protein
MTKTGRKRQNKEDETQNRSAGHERGLGEIRNKYKYFVANSSGKTDWVREHRGTGNVIIVLEDLDEWFGFHRIYISFGSNAS